MRPLTRASSTRALLAERPFPRAGPGGADHSVPRGARPAGTVIRRLSAPGFSQHAVRMRHPSPGSGFSRDSLPSFGAEPEWADDDAGGAGPGRQHLLDRPTGSAAAQREGNELAI